MHENTCCRIIVMAPQPVVLQIVHGGGIWVLGMLADGNADNKPREV